MKTQKILLLLISLFLFFLPFFVWGNSYIVGGDDTKLYYVFPNEFIKNYALNVASNNTLAGAMTGYASVAYFAPLFFLFSAAKFIPFISTQMLFYGLNISVGFIAFYIFLGLWVKTETTTVFLSKILASLFYIFSPYLMNTLYLHQLLSVYLVSLVPVCLWLFIYGIRRNNVGYPLFAVVCLSLFSTTLNVLPWIMACMVSLIPIILYEGIHHIRIFIKHVVVAGVAFVLMNFYWVFHFVNSLLFTSGQSGINHYGSDSFVAENIRILTGVSRLFSPLTVPMAYMDTQVPKVQPILALLFFLPFISILVAGGVSMTWKKYYEEYFVGISGFMLSWFLFSPNLGEWGPKAFLLLSMKIPFFIMFRNMYDKFSLPLSFYYALLICLSLIVITSFLKKKSVIIIFLIIFSFSLATIFGYSFIQFNSKQGHQVSFSGEFNREYKQLISYIVSLDNPSHILWLPLNGPTYANIEDMQYKGSFYSGLSPLQILTGVPDYAGRFSFIRPGDYFVGEKLFKNIESGDYESAGKLFQQVNAKYIVLDHQKLPPHLGDFMYGGSGQPVLEMQNETFKREILGKKLKDFGTRYTIYEIHERYSNDKFVLSDTTDDFKKTSGTIVYKKQHTSEYEIQLSNITGKRILHFFEPYNTRWKLYILGKNGEKKPFPFDAHETIFGYANGWSFTEKKLLTLGQEYVTKSNAGGLSATLFLRFDAEKYNPVLYTISMLSFLVIIATSGIFLFKERKSYEKQ